MAHVTLPREILPADGRFGCGPSKIRPEQLAALAGPGAVLMGTSHRQARSRTSSARCGWASATCCVSRRLRDHPRQRRLDGVLGRGRVRSHRARAQNLVFGEFGGKFAAAAAAPWLEAPDVRKADAGTRTVAEAVEGVDVYAWPHNETSTGVAAPISRVAGDEGALTVIDATSAAGGINFAVSQTDVYYFAPQKNLGSDGGLWFAAVSPPRSSASSASRHPAATSPSS
jgi:phosphoserine aminotransferase